MGASGAGRGVTCKNCNKEFEPSYYKNTTFCSMSCKHKYRAKWVKSNRQVVNANRRKNYKNKPLCEKRKMHEPWVKIRKSEKYLSWQRKSRQKIRDEFFDEYGGKCSCCGERRRPFLCLEHIYHDGALHRKKVGGGTAIYQFLKKHGWPKDRYTILCMNCNWATRDGSSCPHKDGKYATA